MEKLKELYEEPITEITWFTTEDVIVTSGYEEQNKTEGESAANWLENDALETGLWE